MIRQYQKIRKTFGSINSAVKGFYVMGAALLQGVAPFQLQLPSVSIGRGVKALFELPVEVCLAGKSRHIGNVLQPDTAVFHQFGGILEALFI